MVKSNFKQTIFPVWFAIGIPKFSVTFVNFAKLFSLVQELALILYLHFHQKLFLKICKLHSVPDFFTIVRIQFYTSARKKTHWSSYSSFPNFTQMETLLLWSKQIKYWKKDLEDNIRFWKYPILILGQDLLTKTRQTKMMTERKSNFSSRSFDNWRFEFQVAHSWYFVSKIVVTYFEKKLF